MREAGNIAAIALNSHAGKMIGMGMADQHMGYCFRLHTYRSQSGEHPWLADDARPVLG
jgi:hypothetical protein